MKLLKYSSLLLLPALLLLARCGPDKPERAPESAVVTPEKPAIPMLEYSVVATLPHDTSAFTEGLMFHKGQLLESTGSPQGSHFKSVLGPVDMATGKLSRKAELDPRYFGEGIVVLGNRLYQVTYTTQVGFIYDATTYKKLGQFNYPNREGWGMTTDGTHIIMSDGTETISFFDADFKPVKTISVKENGYAQESLNELEYINGYIYANVWMTGYIVKIDPATGNVVGKLNLTPLSYDMRNLHPGALEMNGIAYDAANDKVYVTGKAWPKMYEIKFAH